MSAGLAVRAARGAAALGAMAWWPACTTAMALVCATAAATTSAPAAATPAPRDWQFQVLLDDRVIGQHRFSLQQRGDERMLVSEARFDVSFLGLTLYRYRHLATERWNGDCLAALDARTDDNGTQGVVSARTEGAALRVNAPDGERSVPGCVMSFAYWHPAMRAQRQLLNAQTGALEAVRIRRVGEALLTVGGRDRRAERWALEGPERPIELWYSAEGEWLGLDAVVARGQRLRYRLP
jgi:hypothetical protein